MAMRVVARRLLSDVSTMSRAGVRRAFSDKGRVLSEEEKAAENVYIKKMERERAEKAARQGVHPSDPQSATSTTSAKASTSSKAADNNRTIAIAAGIVGVLGIGYLLTSKRKEPVREKERE